MYSICASIVRNFFYKKKDNESNKNPVSFFFRLKNGRTVEG